MRRKLLIIALLSCIGFFTIQAQQLNFTWDVVEGCAPLRVHFAIDTASVDTNLISSAVWDFGNGRTITASAGDTVSTVFTEPNRAMPVKLTISGSISDEVTKFYNGVRDPLLSDFTITRERDLLDYTYTFTPVTTIRSDADYFFAWEHYQADSTQLKRIVYLVDETNPEDAIDQYQYADTGIYFIHLAVRETHPAYTCYSETDTVLAIRKEFIVANVFSPQSQDYFIVDPEDATISLSFKLFARTGMQIFEQEAPVIYWDGRNNAGQDMSTGVYYYIIKATQGDQEGFYSKTGFIHLFR